MKKQKQILVLGVGGGGQNILNQLQEQVNNNVRLITINSDEQLLKSSKTDIILFPQEKRIFKKFIKNDRLNNFKYLCNGIFCKKPSYGCAGDVDTGESLAKKHVSLLKNEIKQSNRIFIISTFGGGFGTGAVPVIVDYAKQFNTKLTAIVTMPFRFEGKRRNLQANEGIEKLKELKDNLIVIDNDDSIGYIENKISANEAFYYIGNYIISKMFDICNNEDICI